MKILGLEEILCLFNVTASCPAAELRLNPGLLTPRPVSCPQVTVLQLLCHTWGRLRAGLRAGMFHPEGVTAQRL